MNQESTADLLKEFLPRNTAAKIRETLGLAISERHINRIISGTTVDTYGVLDEALKIAIKEKKKIEKQNQKLLQLQNLAISSLNQ